MNRLAILLSLALGAGCAFDETTGYTDLTGKVRIPKEAAQLNILAPDGTVVEIEDARAIGPVYLGVFPSVRENLFDYLHPEMGPVFDETTPGDTYPYGGTTIGRFQWGCYEELVCKTVTGRYSTYDDLLDFFSNVLLNPVNDIYGHEIEGGTEYQEHCYDAFEITADWELDLVGEELDFQLVGDYYEAETTILHTQMHEGMQVWGWVDMPSSDFKFSTCADDTGAYYSQYADQYYQGTNYVNVLNAPSFFIDDGDWVAGTMDADSLSTIPTINSADDTFELTLGYQFED